MPKSYDVSHLRDLFASCMPPIVARHTETAHRYENENTGKLAWSTTTQLGIVDKSKWLKGWAAKKAVEHVRSNRERLSGYEFDTVLDEASRAHSVRLDEASGWGTTAHSAYDRFMQSWLDNDTQPEESCVRFLEENCRKEGVEPKGEEIAACRSFDLFLREEEVIPLASELQCWYEKKEIVFAGTVDSVLLWLRPRKGRVGTLHGKHDYVQQDTSTLWCAVCNREVDPVLTLGDWKTSGSIKKDEYCWQTVSYAKAIEEAAGVTFDEILIVRFSKQKAEYELVRVADRKRAWDEFKAISKCFSALQDRERELFASVKEKMSILL